MQSNTPSPILGKGSRLHQLTHLTDQPTNSVREELTRRCYRRAADYSMPERSPPAPGLTWCRSEPRGEGEGGGGRGEGERGRGGGGATGIKRSAYIEFF